MLLDIVQIAGIHAIVVVAAVEAIRSRIPKIDGPWVLLLAAGCSLVVASLFLPLESLLDALHAGRVAAISWLLAVGGDSWLVKIAKLKSIKTAVESQDSQFPATEAPTVNDLPRLTR